MILESREKLTKLEKIVFKLKNNKPLLQLERSENGNKDN